LNIKSKKIYLTKNFDNDALAKDAEMSSVESFLSSEIGIFQDPAK
jgi:hypothetical protein